MLPSGVRALWPVAAHGFRRRQTLWVSVNLASILVLLALDFLIPLPRPAVRGVLVRGMLAAGALSQCLDLFWLAVRGVPLPPRAIRPHVGISIALNLLLAFGLAIVSPVGDIQCVVLTVPQTSLLRLSELFRASRQVMPTFPVD